jgi:Arc/MetJ-type ribon-helix-helix transcriptional regulator
MMTTQLPEDLERFVHEAVSAGRYSNEDEVIRDALTRLRQTLLGDGSLSDHWTEHAKPPKREKPLTEAEFDQYLLDIGLMSRLPDTDADFDDLDDEPIDIRGEPLSETVIRERR